MGEKPSNDWLCGHHSRDAEVKILCERIADLERELCGRDCIEVAMSMLRAHGSPLVCPTSDGVLVCKDGTWAFGKDLPEALELMERKIAERKVNRG